VLFEMLSGHAPFRRATEADTVAAILNDNPSGLSDGTRSIPRAGTSSSWPRVTSSSTF